MLGQVEVYFEKNRSTFKNPKTPETPIKEVSVGM